MKINKEELYKLYMEWVDKVTEECDWKTSFTPEEIVEAISTILENNPQLYMNNEKDFEAIYDKIVEKNKGNLTNQEYRELITLEYVVTQGYDEPGDIERYMELSRRR
jgi:hypothetical protein